MDKQYLKKHNLTEAQKRFQMIVEYSYMGENPMVEDGPDQNTPPVGGGAPGGDVPPMGGGAPEGGMPPMGGNPEGGMPPAGPEDPNAMPPGGEGAGGVEGFNPQVDNPPMDTDGNPVGENDEIIDIDELTDTQKDMDHKVSHMSNKMAGLDGKLDKFLQIVDKLVDDIDRNNAHIEQLRQDFEKRNPTQVEKMTLRSKQGYPFSESPDEYWEKKESEGNYSTEDDNNGVDDQRYQITKNDVNNITD